MYLKNKRQKTKKIDNDDDDATTKIIRPRGRPPKQHIDALTDE